MWLLESLHGRLLRMEPESAHRFALWALRLGTAARLPISQVARRCVLSDARLAQRQLGLEFPNPIGLAAGFDKDAAAIRGLTALGFGFLEVGTVTPLPQRGNPPPRLFRFPAEQSLQNSLGFNNSGCQAMRRRLGRQWPASVPVGVNIGKNRLTPMAEAGRDYEHLVAALGDRCDYLTINVSSPNTPGLRDLQQLEVIVDLVQACRRATDRPILLKLAPDLADSLAVELAVAAVEAGAGGLILTNTTTDYSLLPGARPEGGLSGRVLRQRSLEMLRAVAAAVFSRCTLVSVGGIESSAEVYARLRAGATLVQIYTALVFQGPLLVHRLVQGLIELLERDGVSRIADVVGADL